MNLQKIQSLSLQEPKTLVERMVKLQEESGELAQEVLIANKTSGSQYKSSGPDGIRGECADAILVAMSIFFKTGGSAEELSRLLDRKAEKWEKHQQR